MILHVLKIVVYYDLKQILNYFYADRPLKRRPA